MKYPFFRRTGALLLALALLVSLAPAALAADSFSFDSDQKTMNVGVTESITARLTLDPPPQDYNFTVTWVSDNTSVVTVESTTTNATAASVGNRITAVGKGTATITAPCAEYPGLIASCAVTVESKVKSIELTDTAGKDVTGGLTMRSDGMIHLIATARPEDADNRQINWRSSDERIATVTPATTASGEQVTVRGVSGGTVTITATAADGSRVSNGCTIEVQGSQHIEVREIVVTPSRMNMIAGEVSSPLAATVIMTDGSEGHDVTWRSSNEKVATVDESGVVTAVGAGTADIIAASTSDPTKTEACTVTVAAAEIPITGLFMNPTSLVMEVRKSQRLEVGITPSNASNQTLEWSSSDEKVATVGSDGTVTPQSPGKVTITAKSTDGSGKEAFCEIEVSGITLSPTSAQLVVNESLSMEFPTFGNAKGAISWSSSNPSVASASNGKITGHYPGKATITATVYNTGYKASCEVTVVEDVAEAINRSLRAGEKLDFSGLVSELNSRSISKSNAPLDYVDNLRVSTAQGVLYYRYGSPDTPNHGVGGVDRLYATAPSGSGKMALGDVSFVPNGGFSGTAVIEYTGHNTNEVSFHGTIRVEVESTGDVTYSTAMNRSITLSSKEFKDICKLKTGRNASYVTFSQPGSGKGTLYYNYSPEQYSPKVDGTTKYYISSNPLLEKVTFVPEENYTGTISVPYRCTDTTGSSYSGTMTINIYSADGGGSGGVEYTTGINQRLTLNAADFNSACQDANGRTLSYIYFDSLPPASQGILYYSYTSSSSNRVDTSTRYNRSNTGSRISNITFVSASNFSGTVTIPYTGYDTTGHSYKDDLVIHVSDQAGTVSYTTDVGEAVTFRAEDFNEACQRANNSSLNYITVTLPASSVGTLYRNYRNSSNTGSRVSSSQRFSRGGNPSVSDVTFVPNRRYEGTASIPFGGYDAAGNRFEGTVSITVGQATGRVVSYSIASGGVVRFNASDFNAVCRSATGDDLSYVSFELPASRYGTLYYQYNASRGTGTAVGSSTMYYRRGGSRQLDDVSFAAANTNGTATFRYDARSTGGERFSGTVEIVIGSTGGDSGFSSGTRYIGSSAPVALRSVDFQSACQSAVGGTLSHIRFTSLPNASAGRLYMNYASPSRPGAPATTTANYTAGGGLFIGQLSFVPKAGYQGQVNIPYTGYNTQGGSFSGNVTIDLYTSYCATPFYDVDSGWDWAKPSVEFLRYAGISNGYSDNSFRPSRSISRGEFTLMVCRAFGFDTSAKVSSFPDVPASSPYAGAVAVAKSKGIVEGSGGRFNPNSPITRQSAMTMICRAMRAAGERVPATTASALNAYADQAQVSSYARESVAALIQLGVVQGSSDLRINPRRSISRAEMAVILHRVLTL